MKKIVAIKQVTDLVTTPVVRTEVRTFRTVQRKWWRMAADWKVRIEFADGTYHDVIVTAGALWNGASVPFALRGLLNASELFLAGALHDYLYGAGIYNRAAADYIFRCAAIMLDRRPAYRAWAAWLMVRLFAAGHYRRAK